MHALTRSVFAVGAIAALGPRASAQLAFLANDRDNDKVWLLIDRNNDGLITGAGETSVFFDATNAAGTLGVLGPSTIGVRKDGLVLVGDNDASRRRWVWLRDVNRDGDALDVGESGVFAEAGNPGGFLFGSPTGVAFLPSGQAVLANAGNASGSDSLFIAGDQNGDNDAMDAGEVVNWVTVNGFGAGNGSYGPQEPLALGEQQVLFKNSSTNLHGVYRLVEGDNTGAIDATSEFTTVFSTASGIALGAGFSLEGDRDVRGVYYTNQTISLPPTARQVIRLQDANDDGDTQDTGEALIAFSSTESGLAIVDLVSLPGGALIASDSSGGRLIKFEDLVGGDHLYNDPSERSTIFTQEGGVSLAGSFVLYPTGCNSADVVSVGGGAITDGQLTVDDLIAFVNAFSAGEGCPDVLGPCNLADITGVGGPPAGADGQLTVDDLIEFVNAFSGGC